MGGGGAFITTAPGSGLKLTVSVEYQAEDQISRQKLDEVRNALRELGLSDKID